MKPLSLLCSAAILAGTLSACGGSGVTVTSAGQTGAAESATTDSRNNVTVATGQFLDSAVSGLYYETESFSGYTDEAGGFSYVPGEYVRFYLGSTFLGEALAKAAVTPLDLLNVQDNPDKLQNILQILQTIDSDSDPSNGITITDAANDYLTQFTLPLNDPSVLFQASTAVQNTIAALTNGSGLKDAFSSFQHFNETLLSSRRQEDEAVVLNLMNTRWAGTVRSSACPEDAVAEMTMRFTSLGIMTKGYHGVNEDSCKPERYGILFETYVTNLEFACANECTASDLNRVILGRDEQTVTTLSYQPDTDTLLLSTVPESGATSTLALTRVEM